MNIKRMHLFLTDRTILPGYHAREGMKFVEYKSGMPRVRAGMKVVREEGKNIFLWDSETKMEFKLPKNEIKATTIVRTEEKHGT